MSSKKKTAATLGTNSPALKIGSRVRCTDDNVEGRIVWANAASVKITWNDGEQVTWRRDSLADRPIEILAEGSDEDQPESPVAPNALAPTEQTEVAQPEPEAATTTPATTAPEQSAAEAATAPAVPEPSPVEQPVALPPPESIEVPVATATEPMAADTTHTELVPRSEVAREEQYSLEPTDGQSKEIPVEAKRSPTRKAQSADDGKEKRLSALDAAAKVLAETGQAMTCQDLVAAMAAKGYWTSPGGKTPQATLYSAIGREIDTKGNNSRFVKAERGKFARRDTA